MQLCGSLNILWHCFSLGLEWKLTFSSPVATAEFSKLAGMVSATLNSIIKKRTWNSSSGHTVMGSRCSVLPFICFPTQISKVYKNFIEPQWKYLMIKFGVTGSLFIRIYSFTWKLYSNCKEIIWESWRVLIRGGTQLSHICWFLKKEKKKSVIDFLKKLRFRVIFPKLLLLSSTSGYYQCIYNINYKNNEE